MEDSILQEIGNVFGFSLEDSKEFMNNMDMKQKAPEGYFTALLQKLNQPTVVEFPKRPNNIAVSKISYQNEEIQRLMDNIQKQKEDKYKQNMESYVTRLEQYHVAPKTNNTILVNEGKYRLNNDGKIIGRTPYGEYGYVKRNKKSPFIYKFLKIRSRQLSDEKIRQILTEPLINCILQQDPLAEAFTCKLYKFYGRQVEEDYEFIFKLEDLKGDSVEDEFTEILKANTEEDKQENLSILLRVFGPLLEVLQILREKYSFEHGDLHGENLMFIQKPNFKEKTNLQVKMIDFGYTSMNVQNKQYGKVGSPYSEVYYLLKNAHVLPKDIYGILETLLKENKIEQVSSVFLNAYKTMKGGKRKQTRKQKSKHRKTRRN